MMQRNIHQAAPANALDRARANMRANAARIAASKAALKAALKAARNAEILGLLGE